MRLPVSDENVVKGLIVLLASIVLPLSAIAGDIVDNRIWDELLCRYFRSIEITTAKTNATDVQIPWDPNRYRLQIVI